jgi:hypothetical protein
MAANIDPIFTLTPNAATAEIAAADTSRDGSGTLVTLLTAGTDGSRIEYIRFTSAQAIPAANSAMVVRVFLTDTGGANPRLISEEDFPSVTASNIIKGGFVDITYLNGLTINAGQIIKVSQSLYAGVEDKMQVLAVAGDY